MPRGENSTRRPLSTNEKRLLTAWVRNIELPADARGRVVAAMHVESWSRFLAEAVVFRTAKSGGLVARGTNTEFERLEQRLSALVGERGWAIARDVETLMREVDGVDNRLITRWRDDSQILRWAEIERCLLALAEGDPADNLIAVLDDVRIPVTPRLDIPGRDEHISEEELTEQLREERLHDNLGLGEGDET
jgi:hypothetical protein